MERQFYGLLWNEVLVIMALGGLGSDWHTLTEVRRKLQTADTLRVQLTSPTIFKILEKLDQTGLVESQFHEQAAVGERLKYRLATIGLQYYSDIRAMSIAGYFD